MRYFAIRMLLIAGLFAWTSPAFAIDVVVKRNDQREGGKITKQSKAAVVVTKQVGGDTTVPVNEIAYIEWDSAPASLALARTSLESGQLDTAQKQLEEAIQEAGSADNDGLQGDLDYLLARVYAARAVGNPSQRAEAVKRLTAFISGNRDHYRLYDAQLLLGEVATAAGDFPAAVAAFTVVGTAPWKDYQMAAQIGQGRVLLAQGNVDGAKREFDAVAAVKAEGAAQSLRRLQGLLGQARCLQLKDQHEESIKILDQVIDESSSADSRLQAEAYVRQGDAYVAMGANAKDAIMAYLHVDVVPSLSKEADLHAEALFHLARLWKSVGQDERARDAAEALRGQYPESEWAKKFAG